MQLRSVIHKIRDVADQDTQATPRMIPSIPFAITRGYGC